MDNISTIVSKVWFFCSTLRDDSIGDGDYPEQFLKTGFGNSVEPPA